ncbi:MAG: type II toxin-antitoxin system HicB family antitoxin [Bryobacterales bacterium]|nr:type II toxin-antitoxin system HicB family antitoxin [Bryobacterales bacterium]
MKYAVIYEKTATGYSAYALDIPGCVAAGATLAETAELKRGAIELHLETMREDGDAIPEATTVADSISVPH